MVTLLGLGLVATVGTVGWLQPQPADDFYLPPDGFADHAPGTLLRSEGFTRGLPGDVVGWRILYRSTGVDGAANVVSGLVLEPAAPATSPRPLLAIVHGSTGVAEECAPSLAARPLAPLPGVEEALDAGYAVVATDLPGLGTPGPHPYLIGDVAAHAVLDSVRAARSLRPVDEDHLAVWGFSQGGHAALFAGELAGTYAPELPLDAVVAFAPAADLAGILEHGQGTLFGTLFTVTAAVAWSEFDDTLVLEDVVADEAVDRAREVADRCLIGTALPGSTARSLQLRDEVDDLSTALDGPWGAVVSANSPTGPIDAPLLVLQGSADPFIPAELTAANMAARCDRGDDVELRVIPAAEHFTLARRGADDAVAWTTARLAGEPTGEAC